MNDGDGVQQVLETMFRTSMVGMAIWMLMNITKISAVMAYAIVEKSAVVLSKLPCEFTRVLSLVSPLHTTVCTHQPHGNDIAIGFPANSSVPSAPPMHGQAHGGIMPMIAAPRSSVTEPTPMNQTVNAGDGSTVTTHFHNGQQITHIHSSSCLTREEAHVANEKLKAAASREKNSD